MYTSLVLYLPSLLNLARCMSNFREEELLNQLMPHQREAVMFLADMKTCGSLLAWQAGCGKTLPVLLSLFKRNTFPALIVAPAPLLGVWVDELKKWFGQEPILLRGTPKVREELYKNFPTERRLQIFIVSYETLRIDFEKFINKIEWQAIVLDESGKIRSPRALVTKKILKLKAPLKIAMDGNPISNGIADLWAVSEFLEPNILYGSFWTFRNKHARMNPYIRGKIDGWLDRDFILEKVAHLVSWKKKKDVLKDLPPVVEQEIRFDLNSVERDLYNKIKREILIEMDGEETSITNALTRLLRLRQCVNGTISFMPDAYHSTKVDTLLELVGTLPEESKIIIFTSFLDTAEDVERRLSAEKGIKCVKITGSTPTEEREKAVRKFQESPFVRVMVGTDAMSRGLNLQAAEYVVNVDLPWSYATYDQRIGRAWRQGQKKPVTVYNLIANKTVDEHVQKILARKIGEAEEACVTMEDVMNILAEPF
mgnify:FL=1